MSWVVSWSGGKDCCWAAYIAGQEGRLVQYMLNTTNTEGTCSFHGVNGKYIRMQSQALGYTLVQVPVRTADEYEAVFKRTLIGLQEAGVKGGVFGDIYHDEHKIWVERMCAAAGIQAYEPLWGKSAESLVRDFVAAGFKAVIVRAHAQKLGNDLVGRIIDDAVIDEFIRRGICPCGENGEYHTLVVDGPSFTKRLVLRNDGAVYQKGYWDHWSLNIVDCALENK